MEPAGERVLRVLLGMPFGSRHGGSEKLMGEFVRLREAVAVDPHVVFLEDGPWPAELRADGVRVTVLEPGRFREPRRNAAALARLRRLMAAERPDVVLAWITRAHVLFAPAATAAGMRHRLAWFEHLMQPDLIERVATLLPTELVLTCSHAAADAQARLWPRRETHVAYPGMELPELLAPAARDALRAELDIPSGSTVIGVSGRLVRRKNQDAVLRAVALLGERDVHCLVLGGEGHGQDAGYAAELRELAASLGIARRVTFTGHREDAIAVTQLMDVAVNALELEGFGLAVLEALAVGIPVVAVGRGGPAEIVEHGITGLLVDAPEPEQLAAALRPLVGDPDRRAAMGRAGRGVVAERFTLERFVRDVRRGLDRVADGAAAQAAAGARRGPDRRRR